MKALFCWLLMVCAAVAQVDRPTLGMTEAQARERFGPPLREHPDPVAEKVLAYEKGEFRILATVMKGRIVSVLYGRLDGRPLHEIEGRSLRQRNAPEARWSFDHELDAWMTSDGKLLSSYGEAQRTMTVSTVEYVSALARAATRKLDGL